MVNCSLKLRIDTKNCIKCTHNLVLSCSAIPTTWCVSPLTQSVLAASSKAAKPLSWHSPTLHLLWTSFLINPLPTWDVQCQYRLSSRQGSRESSKISLQRAPSPNLLAWAGTESTETCPWPTEVASLHVTAASVALGLSSSPFDHKG